MELSYEKNIWQLREPFVIARGIQTEVECIVVTLTDDKRTRGRGEGCPVDYAGENFETMAAQIEQVRSEIEAGTSREALLTLLPSGGARNAIDAALWDIEAKRTGKPAFEMAGLDSIAPVRTAYTIGIRSAELYTASAKAHSSHAMLKIKVSDSDPIRAIAAAREGAPHSAFIVDPNQSWTVSMLKSLAPRLVELGVVLLEQPIKVGDEPQLDGYRCPISLCADELINDRVDLEKAMGRFDVINIKLDKAGGLTEALRLAASVREAGFELMVGSMLGSSLSMAPAMVLAQGCRFVDLDSPLLLAEDWPNGLTYREDVILPQDVHFWG